MTPTSPCRSIASCLPSPRRGGSAILTYLGAGIGHAVRAWTLPSPEGCGPAWELQRMSDTRAGCGLWHEDFLWCLYMFRPPVRPAWGKLNAAATGRLGRRGGAKRTRARPAALCRGGCAGKRGPQQRRPAGGGPVHGPVDLPPAPPAAAPSGRGPPSNRGSEPAGRSLAGSCGLPGANGRAHARSRPLRARPLPRAARSASTGGRTPAAGRRTSPHSLAAQVQIDDHVGLGAHRESEPCRPAPIRATLKSAPPRPAAVRARGRLLPRQRKLLPPRRMCGPEMGCQRWQAPAQKRHPTRRTVMAQRLRFPARNETAAPHGARPKWAMGSCAPPG